MIANKNDQLTVETPELPELPKEIMNEYLQIIEQAKLENQ
jgi:hypothetical protein